MDLHQFNNLPLRGGFVLVSITVAHEPMTDAMNRVALARTTIIGNEIKIELAASHADGDEFSVSLYHEVLEATAVASAAPPQSVWELNEAGFERAALDCFRRFGPVNPKSLNQMLAEFGF